MKLSADLKAFQDRLGYRFSDPEYLIRALTHSSIGSPTRENNQRLEFLGDRVLGLVMAEALLETDRDASEGQLAPRYNALVRKEACAAVAVDIDLGDVLKLGRSEMMSGGRRKKALLGDAMEAVIAAVYQDGGFNAAKDLVMRLWHDRLNSVETDARDPKTALQEWTQANGKGLPVYQEISREGPDHAPVFTIEVQVGSDMAATAKAASKRKAEQSAAATMLARLNVN